MSFCSVPGASYLHNYVSIFDAVVSGELPELATYRTLMLEDLWFLVYFGMRISIANHPFWVASCNDLQNGPRTHTLDLWAREHGKSSIITTADSIQRVFLNREERIGIFSYTQPAANSFLRGIKHILEKSEFLKACFPDILFQDPKKEADKWSESEGLIVRREGYYREATFEAWGLIEGMPTGKHFTHRVYDDIMTEDLTSPEMVEKVKLSFDLSQNLGTVDGTCRIIGTPYHHEDVLKYVEAKVDPLTGERIYHVRKKPATIDGTPNGRSVYLPEPRLAELRTNPRLFRSQQLLDPTPAGTAKLSRDFLIPISPQDIPRNCWKFMAVDPAGMEIASQKPDAWGLCVIGVEPCRDDLGASNVYIIDLLVEPMSEAPALQAVVDMYSRNGRVMKLGVEKVAMSSAEIHVANALRAKGRAVTVENGGLVVLRPSGRSKEQRIVSNLEWPLNNGKIHISRAIPDAYRARLMLEMDKFPFWHDDALDALSYCYDLIRGYVFGARPAMDEEEDPLEKRYFLRPRHEPTGWMVQ